jgi:molybdenum cofactor cytidylyltransferase
MSQIVGILLAAGVSRRFGSDKRLQPLADGTPMALVAARNLAAACRRCILVIRPDDTALAQLLSEAGLETVVCPDAEQGMGHSLAAGVAASADATGWLVALADMPYIQPATAPFSMPCRAGRPWHGRFMTGFRATRSAFLQSIGGHCSR